MKRTLSLLSLAVVGFVGCFFLSELCTYYVREGRTVIITQFGKIIGQPVTAPGLHYKWPLFQQVNEIDTRFLEWDGQAVTMPTKDKLYITVDSFGRWRISDPLLWFTRLRDERSALSRIEDIAGSEERNAVASHDLIEIVRTDKNRQPQVDESLGLTANQQLLPTITVGRTEIERQVLSAAAAKLKEFGIELIDIRFMRINYSTAVTEQINNRMISERKQIADRFRSEGEGEAAKIQGNKERDLQEITSAAYAKAQKIRGDADAEAARIYAAAYNQSPASVELYAFLKTMDTYKRMSSNDVTLVLSTDSDIYKFLKSASPSAPAPKR